MIGDGRNNKGRGDGRGRACQVKTGKREKKVEGERRKSYEK